MTASVGYEERTRVMKRFFTILLSVALIFTGFPMLPQNSSHAAKRHWALPYLNNLVRSDVMKGDLDGNLRPNSDITRAEFVTMVNRAFGYNQKGRSNFSDVPKGAWFSDDMNIAKNQGYMQGVAPNRADPKGSLTREQAVTLICRALKIEGIESDTFKFEDSRQFSQWSKEYINATVLKQIVSGYPDSTFKPKNKMTRGEMAKVLSNLAGEIIREEGNNYIGYADKNVSMVQSGANLRDTIIPGDLFLTAGLGKGYTLLDKVVVNGDLIVSGTGNSESGKVSVLMKDTDVNHLIIDSQSSDIMSVRAEGGSVIEKTTIKRNAYLEEDNDRNIAFKDVLLKGIAGTKLNLAGNFENVKIMAPNNQLSLSKGYINSLTVDEEAEKGSVFLEKDTKVDALMIDTPTTVTGSGKVEQVVINADGTNISMLPKKIYIRPGVKAVINGRTMTSLDGEANNANPAFSGKYPKITDIEATTAKLLAMVNKPGKIYWAVKDLSAVNAGASEESLLKPDKRYFIASGNQIAVAEKEIAFQLRPLKSGQTYEYYIMFEDLNKQKTEIESGRFTTTDVIVPQFLSSTPVVTGKTKSSFDFNVMASKDATLYWAVYKNKATPPTPESLAEQKVSGAIGKGKRSVDMNESYTITISGTDGKMLLEHEKYDVYFVLRDSAGNLSRLSKKMEDTQDETPPEFYQGYPWNEPGGASNVTVRTMANESGTIYWAAYPQDFKFPPVDDFDLKSPAEQKELKIRAVTTGQKAFKHGQKPVKEKLDEKLIINGLKKETPYDIYFVLKDKANNYSDVKVLRGVKTLDKTPPKAEMVFDNVVAGDPIVSSNVSIQFNEIVYYDGTENDIRLIELNSRADKVPKLKEIVKLHDLKKLTLPDFYPEDEIDYEKIAIEEVDGKTVIKFSPKVFAKSKPEIKRGLNSGGRYQFELSKIIDSDGNRMDHATKLKVFNVVAPQIGLQVYAATDGLGEDETGFSLKALDTIINSDDYYDIIISSDRLITFELYEDGRNITGDKPVRIEANQGKSVTKIRKPITQFQKFGDITDRDYKLKIKTIDAVSNPESWDGDLNIKATVVTGTKGELQNLSNSIINKTNTMGIVAANKLIQQVSNPRVYTAKTTYADTAPPEIKRGINFVDIFDTTAYATVMTDKPAEIYYVIIPFEDFKAVNERPTPDEILKGKPNYINGKIGKIMLESGNFEVREFIKDLKPETEYKFFYVIKGKSSDDLKVHDTKNNLGAPDFKTTESKSPQITELVPALKADLTSANVRGTADSEAVLYWVAYIHGTKKIAGDPGPGDILTVDDVIGMKDDDASKTSSGHEVLKIETDKDPVKKDIQFEFTVGNLDPRLGYDVFVALQNDNSGKKSPEVYKMTGTLRSQDTTEPKIIDKPKTTIMAINELPDGTYSYDAHVIVEFTKPLYYRNQQGIGEPEPLTKDLLFDTASPLDAFGTYVAKSPVNGGLLRAPGYTSPRGIPYVEAGSGAINGVDLYLKNLKANDTVGFTGYIYSIFGRYAGQFTMTFVVKTPLPKGEDGKVKKDEIEAEFVGNFNKK